LIKKSEKLPAIVIATPGGGLKEQTAAMTTLTFSGYDYAKLISPTPLLAIVESEAETAPISHQMLKLIDDKETTELFTIQGATHIDLYDKDKYVNQAVDKIAMFFN